MDLIAALIAFVSALVNALVAARLYKVAKATESVALEADALHLKTDVYTSLGVAIGLGLILLTGIKWFDPVVVILVAIFIIVESFNLLKKAFTPLLDTAWSEKEITELEDTLNNLEVNYHDLRTRVAGNYRFLDLHIEIPGDVSLENFADPIKSV